MRRIWKAAAAATLALTAAGCSLGSLLGGGGDTPPYLLTLSPQAPEPASVARAASAGEAVTIAVPVVPEELRTVRIPVHMGPTAIAYVKDAQWADTPNEIFQNLLAETVTRMTGRVVLDPRQSALDPGLLVSGQLRRMGYDAQLGQVVVEYDAQLATAGGTRVETRRFEATAPADGTVETVGPALNQAANQVAMQFAQWIAG